MNKPVTIIAAWITFSGLVIAAIIYGVFIIVSSRIVNDKMGKKDTRILQTDTLNIIQNSFL